MAKPVLIWISLCLLNGSLAENVALGAEGESPSLVLPPRDLSVEPESTQVEPDTPKTLEKIDQDEQLNIYRYHDIYLIGGKPDTKVQLSFKLMPIFHFPLFFSYTQLMFWKVAQDSKPFKDIMFNPELFYVKQLGYSYLESASFGFEHRSNGKDDLESRSLDRLFVELESRIGYGTFRMAGSMRFYWIYDVDWQTNANIRKFTGVTSAHISLDGMTEKFFRSKGEIFVNLLPGGNFIEHGFHGAVELNVKYRFGLTDLMPYILFQYYYGYMESLLQYDKIAHSYRIGLTF